MYVLIFTKKLATLGLARKKKFEIAGNRRKKSHFLKFLKLETEILVKVPEKVLESQDFSKSSRKGARFGFTFLATLWLLKMSPRFQIQLKSARSGNPDFFFCFQTCDLFYFYAGSSSEFSVIWWWQIGYWYYGVDLTSFPR